MILSQTLNTSSKVLVKKSAKSSPYLSTSNSNMGAIDNPYAVSSSSSVNSYTVVNNPYLDAVAATGSNSFSSSYPALPSSSGGDLASSGSNFMLDSNARTFTVLSSNNNNYIPSVQQTTKKPFVRVAIQ